MSVKLLSFILYHRHPSAPQSKINRLFANCSTEGSDPIHDLVYIHTL